MTISADRGQPTRPPSTNPFFFDPAGAIQEKVDEYFLQCALEEGDWTDTDLGVDYVLKANEQVIDTDRKPIYPFYTPSSSTLQCLQEATELESTESSQQSTESSQEDAVASPRGVTNHLMIRVLRRKLGHFRHFLPDPDDERLRWQQSEALRRRQQDEIYLLKKQLAESEDLRRRQQKEIFLLNGISAIMTEEPSPEPTA